MTFDSSDSEVDMDKTARFIMDLVNGKIKTRPFEDILDENGEIKKKE